jgi:hypothetical protein
MHRVGRVLSFFSSRWNWDSPTPSPAGECASPRFWGGHTRWRERGWEGLNSDEGTYTVVLFIYIYFVGTWRYVLVYSVQYVMKVYVS